MACKQGIRKSIEASKLYYAEQRKYDPFRELWKSLVHRHYETPGGYAGFTTEERTYYAVGMLDGEVYNGGMHQYFSNSSGEMYEDAVNGLLELGARESLQLLVKAKKLLFESDDPPREQAERWKAMKQYDDAGNEAWAAEVEKVDRAYCKDPDGLDKKLKDFATERGLLAPFIKPTE